MTEDAIDAPPHEVPHPVDTDYEIGQNNITPFGLDIHNPVFLVSGLSIVAFVILTLMFQAQASSFFTHLPDFLTSSLDWFFLSAANVFVIFCFVLMLTPLGSIRLGGDDATPDYSYMGWFAMLFAAGMGIGLMFFGVLEPVYHFQNPPLGVNPEDVAAARAMGMAATIFHWGLHPWAIYALLALGLALFSFNKGLPLTIRSVFYPLLGERVWGWFPFSTHLKILAGKVNKSLIHDVSPHRAGYAPVYAQFDRASANPLYDPAREDQDSLLRGLFMTSWLVEDFLHVNQSFGATAVLITSASSKTSIALAYCLQQRGLLTRIGITSPGNIAFCDSLDCYDKLATYGEVDQLDAGQSVVLVDMAGSSRVLTDLHHHFGDQMKHSCRIGATHITEMSPLGDLPGARPQFFFAPAHVKSRSEEIGPGPLMKQMGGAFAGFRRFSDSWLQVQHNRGPEAVNRAYQEVLAGKTSPASGQVISMWPDAPE